MYSSHNWKNKPRAEYTRCVHSTLSNREELSYKWLELESAAYNALKSVVLDQRLLSDILYLTEFKHSGNLEVYHSLMLKYLTKHLSQLAVLDHNSGIARK